jgi:F-type H+-transporting ATPase subunit b
VSPSWVTFLFEVGNFLLLVALLGWLFFRPVRELLERRRAALQAEEEAVAAKRAEMERALAEVESRRGALETSVAELRERVREDAERERANLLEGARAQVQRERESFQAELEALRRGQLGAAIHDAAAGASEMVRRLLERIDGPDLESSLLEAARRELAALASSAPLAPLVVESASALKPEGLAALAQAAGVPLAQVTQRTTPELLAGVRVLTARGLVDASAAGLAAHAERMLASRIEAGEKHGG